MTIYIILCVLLAVVVGAIVCVALYDALGLRAVEREINALPDVPESDKATAVLCMGRAQDADLKARLYDLSAPLVMAFVIPFVARSANALPSPFSKWDNNISLNGDSGGVLIPHGHPESIRYSPTGEDVWVDYRDIRDWDAVQDCLMVTYDDERYGGDCYYARGHHPRSRWARYVWVGLRNRATRLAFDLGEPVADPIQLLTGSADISTEKEGHFLLRCGDTYHYKSFSRFSLLGRDLVRIRSYGFKLEIAKGELPGQADRAAVVAIGWSAKGWKG